MEFQREKLYFLTGWTTENGHDCFKYQVLQIGPAWEA